MSEPDTRSRPLLVFDGECGFCRRIVARWEQATGDAVEYRACQELPDPFAGVSHEAFARTVHLFQPDGQVTTSAHAVFQLLRDGAGRRWPLWFYRHVPLVRPATEFAYRFVARHRTAASRIATLMWGRDLGPASHLLTRWLFIRLVAIVYLIAFVSIGVQILGLIGSRGILPAAEYLEAVHQNLGSEAYTTLPTLAWINCSDGFLQWLCWAGAAMSVMVIFRIAPALLLTALWVMYLSLYHVGQTFLSFQWDILLLETGLLAIFFAPWKLRPRLALEPPPSRLVLWLIRWLAFRLMFCSGVVKLLDEDQSNPTWRTLTALTYHYETQCIPNAVAWYVHQLPLWFQQFSVACVFAIEIGVPFLIFLPWRFRITAFFPLVFLQLLIILTGNYNFFNLLSIALCLCLLDDTFLRRFLPRRLSQPAAERAGRPRRALVHRLCSAAIAIVILPVSAIWMAETFQGFQNLPPTCQEVLRFSIRFAVVNNYGQFRSMTTHRPEIIVEGSRDGRTWQTYEFKWKPGDLGRRPPFVAPHQPRLDWQMWFAALGDFRHPRNQWFLAFSRRLLEGEPQVLALLEHNPFPDGPPKWIRAELYDYHFTDAETRRKTGHWWTRQYLRPYTPALSLDMFRQRP